VCGAGKSISNFLRRTTTRHTAARMKVLMATFCSSIQAKSVNFCAVKQAARAVKIYIYMRVAAECEKTTSTLIGMMK